MKKETNKISVIIPTYNRAKLLSRSVKSVINQTYKNLEIIIVDDGSTDNTEEVIKKIKDRRVKYIKLNKNKGACHARNRGIKEATGKYIAFQDSDDVFLPNKLQKQYDNMIKNNSDMDFCKICIHQNESTYQYPNNEQEDSIINNQIIDELCNGNFISTQAIVVKSSIAKENLFDDEIPRLQDYDFVMRVVSNYKTSYTNEVLVDLFRQTDSISNKVNLEDAIKVILAKNYNISKYQKQSMIDWLVRANADEKVQEINFKYNTLLNKYNILKQEYGQTDTELNMIKNSGSYKLARKLSKIKKTITFKR